MDQDGREDLAIGAPSLYNRSRERDTYLFSGTDLQEGGQFSLEDAAHVVRGHQKGEGLGRSLAHIQRDNTSHLLIGAPGYDDDVQDQGALYVVPLP